MAHQYSIAEARHDLAAIVRKLEQHPFVEITRRGKPVAVLLSIEEFQRLSTGRSGFWQAYSDFRQSVNLPELGITPEIFEDLRSPETGRPVEF
jgi:prevent-host-death family protein